MEAREKDRRKQTYTEKSKHKGSDVCGWVDVGVWVAEEGGAV